MIMCKEALDALCSETQEYMWDHNHNLRKDKRFQKLCNKQSEQFKEGIQTMKAFMLVDKKTKKPIQYYRESPSSSCLWHIVNRVNGEEAIYHHKEMFIEVEITEDQGT